MSAIRYLAPAARLCGTLALALLCLRAPGQTWGGELRFCLRADPRTFNPILVDEEAGETIRYLTGGVLVRINRRTQELEPELARSWKILDGGRGIEFVLREGVHFSDGSPLDAEDVAFTIRSLMDPGVHSPTGDSFRSGPGPVETRVYGRNRVVASFPRAVAGLARLFDQVAIVSPKALAKASQPVGMPVLGPYRLAEYKPGSYVLLARNPFYWKTDPSGRRLPYIDRIRISIQQNRDIEMFRFLRGELDLINSVDPEAFERLAQRSAPSVMDSGPSLESEQMWFNQVPSAPLPDYKKRWFASRDFRRAISEAINREDICRVVYRRRAAPAAGPVSPANRFWFNAKLKPHPYDPKSALERLRQIGFRKGPDLLRDRSGNPVEFSLLTNSGNKARERIATMVQQDLAQLGIRLNVIRLDFPSLLERISRSFHYEACLLGLINVDLDPNAQMNLWLSSAENHQWNPRQSAPQTPWEAAIDRLMLAQAAETSPRRRKTHFDRVQEIVWEEAPFLYLVNPNSLCAAAAGLKGMTPAVLRPQTYWNVERLFFAPVGVRGRAAP